MKKIVLHIAFCFSLFIGVANATSNPFYVNDNTISIYPNPVTNQQFVFKTDIEVVKIEIVNIVGNTIYSNVYVEPTTKAEIQLNKIDGGIYILRLETASQKVMVKKFLVK